MAFLSIPRATVALVCPQLSRRYCTDFMQVLARFHMARFEDWGLRLLIEQLTDQSHRVARSAVQVLRRLLDEKVFIFLIFF